MIVIIIIKPISLSSSYLFHGYQKGTSPLNWLPLASHMNELVLSENALTVTTITSHKVKYVIIVIYYDSITLWLYYVRQ